MSHEATAWAVLQRGISPGAKVVLWHLADRHNPDFGCFPSQEKLANDAEMSRSTVNAKLKELEDAGLIRRIQSRDEATNRQNVTRYILGFEDDEAQVRVRNLHTEAVSENDAEPCPKMGESRVRNSDTNLVRGTIKGTSKKRAISEAAQISQKQMQAGRQRGHSEAEVLAQFDRFKASALANGRKYADWDAAFRNWLDSPYFKPALQANPLDQIFAEMEARHARQ